MTVSPFDLALDLVLINEGGLNLDADEPGGRTAFGIAERWHPSAWAAGPPTKADAERIYREQYWSRIHGDELPEPISCACLDFAVQSGVFRAVRTLQSCLDVEDDGKMGPVTLAAAKAHADPLTVAYAVCDAREAFLMALASSAPEHARRRRGYQNRMLRVRQYLATKWG